MTRSRGTILEYEDLGVHQAIARFGILHTPTGGYDLPAMSPGIRTETDARAVLLTASGGLAIEAVTPLLSWGKSFGRTILDAFSGAGGEAQVKPPLVVPDPEAEAFSFNCIARGRFAGMADTPPLVKRLMSCSLSGGDGREEVYPHWKKYAAHYGFAALEEWLESRYEDVGSRTFFALGPIIRANATRVVQCFNHVRTILEDEVAKALFPMHGAHFLMHSEMFSNTPESQAALAKMYDQLELLLDAPPVPDLFVSFKVWDANGSLLDPQAGSARLRVLSEFTTEISERVRRFRGAVIGHNFANLGLGILDSGADIASFRVSGPMRIDTPVRSVFRGPRPVPRLFNHGTLSEEPVEAVVAQWRSRRAFPVPAGVTPQPYWTKEGYTDQLLYASHVRCAALVELGREYRAAGLDKTIPLSEALRSRILRSEVRQALLDLSPSLANG